MQIQKRKIDYDGINKIVAAEFACKHTETRRCKKIKSNHEPEIRNQCKRCGDQVGHAVKKASLTQQEIENLPLWDDQISVRFATQRNQRHVALSKQDEDRINAAWYDQYDIYLDSPEWKKRRQLVLMRAQGVCEGCRSAPATEVHHLTYEHVGDELLFELVAICDKCHRKIHPPEAPAAPGTSASG